VAALKPRGVLVVMDAFPESLARIEALQARLEAAGLRVMDLPPRLTWRGRLAERVDQALGRNGTLPQVVVARKEA
jgi:adenine-specific DNA methylase